MLKLSDEVVTDLAEINRRLAVHLESHENPVLRAYLALLPICIGRLSVPVDAMKSFLAQEKSPMCAAARDRIVPLDLAYVTYLRLAGKDVLAGCAERLIETGLSLEEARFFASLSNDDIRRIAAGWATNLFDVRNKSEIEAGARLPASAARQHAALAMAWA